MPDNFRCIQSRLRERRNNLGRIKEPLGKVSLPRNFKDALCAESFEQLPVTHEHAHAVIQLPEVHRDPFDRLLIAQARVEDLTILSDDRIMPRHDVSPCRLKRGRKLIKVMFLLSAL